MTEPNAPDPESFRLAEDRVRKKNWKRWGPYLSERQWGTVREDYSPDGSAWDYFPHDMARSHAYRWGEDGIAGLSDRHASLCFALALWNGVDPYLKERLFGLTGAEGNHGEDVKEYVFHENRYFDVFVTYAKASPEDILVEIEVANRGPEAAPIHLLPTLWFRNTWSWGQDVASKFFEHFVYIARAMNDLGGEGIELWDKQDGFYYDVLHLPGGGRLPMRVRSMVGLIPLFAVETLEPDVLDRLPGFKRRMQWFIDNRPDFASHVETISTDDGSRRFLSLASRDRLRSVCSYLLDPDEFLSDFGIRAVSRFHKEHPYVIDVMGMEHRVDYEPAEWSNGLFGGNSNWRGPIWFPVNYLIIESLQKFHHFLGDSYKVEFPTRSGERSTLWDVAGELSRRLTRIFLRDESGRRPVYGGAETFQSDRHWRDYVLFYEYFHGDIGAGIGASHQTGWTGLVAKLIQQSGE